MIRFFKNKRALGAPVGNLIILMAAVVLSTTVVLFAINVTTNQVQKESLYISQASLNLISGEITIENTGPTSVMVRQIIVKGETFTSYVSNPDIGTDGLAKGDSATLSITLGGVLSTNDIGRPITIVISTTQASYFIETIVKANSGDVSGSA
jgi:hypothetical protein